MDVYTSRALLSLPVIEGSARDQLALLCRFWRESEPVFATVGRLSFSLGEVLSPGMSKTQVIKPGLGRKGDSRYDGRTEGVGATSRWQCLDVQNASANGDGNSVCPVVGLQLIHDILDVKVHCILR
jgi:hypothetical protein